MKTEKGTLKKAKKSFVVTVATKKGTADLQIPLGAQQFRAEDAAEGLEVEVERDAKNLIVKVTIPGKPQSPPPAPVAPKQQGKSYGRSSQRGPSQPQAVNKLTKAAPSVLEGAFHNPYTFLPFPEDAPKRCKVTPLSKDEGTAANERFTGILDLEVTTERPLLSCHPQPLDDTNPHKTYAALKIGPDVIVPATGIRGALRTLLTIITGGTLGYISEHAYLCQGRDANLGPRSTNSPAGTPDQVFLAEVEQPGNDFRDGVVRLGETQLVPWDELARAKNGGSVSCNPSALKYWVGLNSQGKPPEVATQKSPQTPWKLKLSGRPINSKGKREGVFLAGDQTITLPAELWAAYSGRNVHGDRPELRRGDLIWLEPADPHATQINKPEDVKSLQWARWGKHGQAIKEMRDQHLRNVWPDYLQDDTKVDAITDLFGQVAPQRGKTPTFAGRLRPENLVFFDVASKVERVTLAPLAPPHPGCIAFYRDNDNADAVSEADQLRGYKVYRVQDTTTAEPPWLYATQGVYGNQGERLSPRQKVNKTCDLVPAGVSGRLRIAFRGVTARELALLLQACALPWRLGGGKPLGLGLCTVRVKGLIDEDGDTLQVPNWVITGKDGALDIQGWKREVHDIQLRVWMWEASQKPVPRLRYPRAVDENNNRKARGGHTWFQRHAKPRMVTDTNEGRTPGLEPLYIDGAVKEKATAAEEPFDPLIPMIAGQTLPVFDWEQPLADVLYGYDMIGAETRTIESPRRRVFYRIEDFDPTRHVTGEERSGGNDGKNAESRMAQKKGRIKDA